MTTASTDIPVSKCERIVVRLRQQIRQGDLAPGSRLPTWDVMEKSFAVGRPTLMRALDQLKRDGFICSDSTRGTFVTNRPPHLYRYALVFEKGPSDPGWNRYWATLSAESTSFEQSQQKQLPLFHFVTGHEDDVSYQRLKHEIITGRLAGIIIVGSPILWRLPLWAQCGLPVVSLHGSPESPTDVLRRVLLDRHSFVRESLEWLKSRQRQRVAVLTNNTDHYEIYRDALPAMGMTTKPFWFLAASLFDADSARNIAHLLFDSNNAERPDGLIITDDNIVEAALGGVVAAGVQVPEQLEIVAQCNPSWPVGGVVPVKRLGFDPRSALQMAIETIDEANKGGRPPMVQWVPATFEEERETSRNPNPSARASNGLRGG